MKLEAIDSMVADEFAGTGNDISAAKEKVVGTSGPMAAPRAVHVSSTAAGVFIITVPCAAQTVRRTPRTNLTMHLCAAASRPTQIASRKLWRNLSMLKHIEALRDQLRSHRTTRRVILSFRRVLLGMQLNTAGKRVELQCPRSLHGYALLILQRPARMGRSGGVGGGGVSCMVHFI